MTALSTKQRAKVNAALCLINDHGCNAQAVASAAYTIMNSGLPPHIAYERALNTFLSSTPELGQAMGTVLRLIEASSPATVAQYDQALSQYIETGNDAAMIALAPTIARDSVALAVHNGEMTQADVQNGGLARALGFEPSATLQQSLAAQPESAPASATPVSSAPTIEQAPASRIAAGRGGWQEAIS